MKNQKEDFLENLYSKEKYGVILDYDLANSNIYGDAIELWETIKSKIHFFLFVYILHIVMMSKLIHQ